MKNKIKGFTLIELLVVISIIGILASLALTSYGGAQKQARDTQRRSDINQYRNGLESYASINNGLYPSTNYTNATGLCTTDLTEFLSFCPDDPLAATDAAPHYHYVTTGGVDYLLYAGLETFEGWWFVCSTGVNGTVALPATPSYDGDCVL